jgi:preprotein translocase SecF subunit
MRLKLIPDTTNIQFINKRVIAYGLSCLMVLASLGLFFSQGLNYGIDFRGGLMIEVGLRQMPSLDDLRSKLNALELGDVAIQEFEAGRDDVAAVLIRIEQQEGGDEVQREAIDTVKALLRNEFGTPYQIAPDVSLAAMTPEEIDTMLGTELNDVEGSDVWTGLSFRRVEVVGPEVSGELIEAGTLAVLLAVAAVLVYIWLRFEWQFGVGAVVALIHDVIITIGFFALTQLEFNLSIIAALLTIVGYSLNDTVVVYDRVRENLRKFRTVPLPELFNTSINETLSRTLMTSGTTLIALFALFFFGGEVIRGFTAAMIWGIFIGTYSSIFVAVPFLLLLDLKREHMVPQED